MDAIQFQNWLSDLGRKFPVVREWLRSITPSADQDALLDAWEQAMSSLELDDCLIVNRLMLSGELDPPGDWPAQWQGLPARMRRHVSGLVSDRSAPGPMSERDRLEHQRNLFVRDRVKAGLPRDRINAQLVAAGFEGIALVEGAT